MRLLLSTLVILSLSLSSCKKELEPQESSDVVAPVTATPATPNLATPAPTPISTTPQPAVAPVAPVITPKGMNPAHGQPGHRCDISIGAPLNSPPGKAAPTQTSQIVTQNSSANVKMTPAAVNPDGTIASKPTGNAGAPAILNAPTAAGMNPPHGQAGHRCDVAVGAPLPK
ncbi:hypothetical protein [Flavobacterium sp. GT3R68]|uniref:hypothetical protein n=1 Tax=Flavobacterium sp. GT3R68 TaxID=2594437 RepID=UPI000F865896|nr:hypothetical protein [Flavobacterium sp. GT3R68]RTY93943.1 hypothetical protein EKL32_13760 [Flavobacterium sp. GSN2]TRW93443.1 hypothetical protein FNW07_00625 [Flavobacterium sp. GT3R68]